MKNSARRARHRTQTTRMHPNNDPRPSALVLMGLKGAYEVKPSIDGKKHLFWILHPPVLARANSHEETPIGLNVAYNHTYNKSHGCGMHRRRSEALFTKNLPSVADLRRQ